MNPRVIGLCGRILPLCSCLTDRCSSRTPAIERYGLGGGEHRRRVSAGGKAGLDERGCWLYAYPAIQECGRFLSKDGECSEITNLHHRRLRRPQRQQTPLASGGTRANRSPSGSARRAATCPGWARRAAKCRNANCANKPRYRQPATVSHTRTPSPHPDATPPNANPSPPPCTARTPPCCSKTPGLTETVRWLQVPSTRNRSDRTRSHSVHPRGDRLTEHQPSPLNGLRAVQRDQLFDP